MGKNGWKPLEEQNNGKNPVNPAKELLIENPQQIKPYRPRKRVSAKEVFGRAVAMTAAAALVVTGLYMAPSDSVPVPTVQARESFGGIRQVVEAHDEKDPFVILDIVPGKASAEVNGKTYDFSLGTIGYLAPGQSPIQQDLSRIFKGDETGQNNTDFYKYTDRKTLTEEVISDSFGGIVYQEAYAGTGEDLRASLWSRIFDSVEVEHDENGILTDTVSYPTGRLYAHVQKRPDAAAGTGSLPARAGFDYNLTGQPNGSTIFGASSMAAAPAEGIYTFAEGQGDYQVIFGEPSMAASGYCAETIKKVSGEPAEVISAFAEYVDATGLYYVKDGKYEYMCTLGEFKGIPRPEPKPENPSDPEKPENPTDPADPENPTEPENPSDPEKPENPTDPADPENPTEPENPSDPENPTDPTDPTNPEQPANPEPDQPEQPSDPEPAPEQTPVQEEKPVASAYRMQSALHKAGTEEGWYLCVGMEPEPKPTPEPTDPESPADPGKPSDPETPAAPTKPSDPETPAAPTKPSDPENPTEPEKPTDPETPTDPTKPTDPENPTDPTKPADPENPADPINPKPTPTPVPQPEMPEEGTYCILKFTYVEAEEEQLLYQIKEVSAVSAQDGVPCPYDSYILERGLFQNRLDAAGTDADAFAVEPALEGQFEYVGGGKGMYKITRNRAAENIAAVSGDSPQDNDIEAAGAEGAPDADVQGVSARAAESTAVYYIEVQNAPVYIRCTDGKDFLRRYVFNSLSRQDNASDDFAIKVNTLLAGEVTQEDVVNADLVYLEDGMGLYLNPDAEKNYISPKNGGNAAPDGLPDVSGMVISCLLEQAVQSLKPVIVDYGIIEDQGNGVSANYEGSDYQKLAKAFLKKDLLAFYNEMAKSGNLANNVLMNVDKDLADHPNKEENEYHYVNRNVYIVNGTPLVGDDFPDVLNNNEAKSGFSEVLAAIRAENILLPEDDRISENVSKAMAVQYIINYSLGLVGEYKDLSILELQPTANINSDLHLSAPNDKSKGVVLYWQREDRSGEGQQILRSSKKIEINTSIRSVAAFNSSYQDINETYNMIFIGLDGQRLYHEPDKNGIMEAVYNDKDLNGKVYHTGDRVANSDTRYDASDITEQKKEALLDYLRAGYPIVVENDCFEGRSAQEAREKDINTKYIGRDTQMYDFLKEAISMGRSEEDDGDEDQSAGIYTIEDVHSSAMFTMQLNAQRPKIELRTEDGNGGNDSDEGQRSSDMIETVTVPGKPGVMRGTIEYRITSDRTGEDKAYMGSLDKHLYLDLNYDGVFAPEEEFDGYQLEESNGAGRISIDFNVINFGIVPWKLEVTDSDNRYRRAQTQGCFTISGSEKAKVRVLQVIDNTANDFANLQEIYKKIDNSMLAYYMQGAETILGMEWDIETLTPAGLADKLTKNANYLSFCDVMVLGFGESGNPGDAVMKAVNEYINAGGSVVISSAGAAEDKGRLGIPAAVLGQRDEKTYGKLGLHSDSKFRYEGIESLMFHKTPSLYLDRVNDGTISRWPYRINARAQLGSRTEVAMPDYLLDIGTAKDAGQPYATAWFTLLDSNNAKGAYSSSPLDGRNNYYVYSKGNVVYVGQSEYKYVYDKENGMAPEGEGTDECRIFVNALMAAYNAGVHRADVSIVAGFNGKTKVESVTVPFDVAFKESGDAMGGILGQTVDVYFRFTDNNIACDKVTELALFYKNAGAPETAELLLAGGGINTADYTVFTSPVWAVENNRLVETTEIVPDKVYRIKAPLEAMQKGEDRTSQICVLLTSRYTRAGQTVEALSMDSVSLTRAQMFLLE